MKTNISSEKLKKKFYEDYSKLKPADRRKTKLKEETYSLERWIKDSDVDGRGILFEFTDSDIPILRDCIRQLIQEGKAEAIKDEIKWLQSILDTKHIADDSRWIIEGRIDKLNYRGN